MIWSSGLTCLVKVSDVDLDEGVVSFENGVQSKHDLVIGADGIGSAVRGIIGVHPDKKPAASSCLHANVDQATAIKMGLPNYSQNSAIE